VLKIKVETLFTYLGKECSAESGNLSRQIYLPRGKKVGSIIKKKKKGKRNRVRGSWGGQPRLKTLGK